MKYASILRFWKETRALKKYRTRDALKDNAAVKRNEFYFTLVLRTHVCFFYLSGVARFQRLFFRSSKYYMAIPHLCMLTKFMIQKKNTLAVALPPEVVS